MHSVIMIALLGQEDGVTLNTTGYLDEKMSFTDKSKENISTGDALVEFCS